MTGGRRWPRDEPAPVVHAFHRLSMSGVRTMSSKRVWVIAVGAGLLVASGGAAMAGDKKSSPPPAPSRPAPAAAPAPRPQAQQPSGGGGGGGGGARRSPGVAGGGAGGNAHVITQIAPPKPGGTTHSIETGGNAKPVNHNVNDNHISREPLRSGTVGNNSGPAGHPPGEGSGKEPGTMVRHEPTPGSAPGHTGVHVPPASVEGARRADENLPTHREEFARDHGPGHDPARDRAFVSAHAHDFHTRDVRQFDRGELARWRRGGWHQDWHYGRWGWWYAPGDVWYPYSVPVYPYPIEVSEIVVPDATVIDAGPGIIADPAVATDGQAYVPGPVAVSVEESPGAEIIVRPLPASPIVTYQCPTPVGIYPEVRLCPTVWAVVP